MSAESQALLGKECDQRLNLSYWNPSELVVETFYMIALARAQEEILGADWPSVT